MNDWIADPEYHAAVDIVQNIRVVNDSAERGVKLANDFLKSAKCEEKYQQILQVVENSRHSLPDQRNRKLETKSWFLTL